MGIPTSRWIESGVNLNPTTNFVSTQSEQTYRLASPSYQIITTPKQKKLPLLPDYEKKENKKWWIFRFFGDRSDDFDTLSYPHRSNYKIIGNPFKAPTFLQKLRHVVYAIPTVTATIVLVTAAIALLAPFALIACLHGTMPTGSWFKSDRSPTTTTLPFDMSRRRFEKYDFYDANFTGDLSDTDLEEITLHGDCNFSESKMTDETKITLSQPSLEKYIKRKDSAKKSDQLKRRQLEIAINSIPNQRVKERVWHQIRDYEQASLAATSEA